MATLEIFTEEQMKETFQKEFEFWAEPYCTTPESVAALQVIAWTWFMQGARLVQQRTARNAFEFARSLEPSNRM